jgi:uncharacterized protein YqiB (DUF1249 family)|tara:strand:- start:1259 stop:1669 length:411 start_codon:yes stop_codon:yes gene_type:complete
VNRLSKTSRHLSVCSANFRRLKKILTDFDNSQYKFLFDDSDVTATFKILDKQSHTLLVDASQFTANKIMDFKFRLQIFLDAKLAEVVSFQNEQPVPFFVSKPKSQSLDEKYQQNQMLTEWLEFIFLKGRVETNILP